VADVPSGPIWTPPPTMRIKKNLKHGYRWLSKVSGYGGENGSSIRDRSRSRYLSESEVLTVFTVFRNVTLSKFSRLYMIRKFNTVYGRGFVW
jgi:hypothetical protein